LPNPLCPCLSLVFPLLCHGFAMALPLLCHGPSRKL
jgi:hypothetical protein